MSPKAVRVTGGARVERFAYVIPDDAPESAHASAVAQPRQAQLVSARQALAAPGGFAAPAAVARIDRPIGDAADGDARERDAFARGYEQGERAGVDVAARQLKAVHERLGQTLDQLVGLREDLTYRTERQVVELALAMAARILHREVSLDRELLLVMARIALDRMGDVLAATIRLHPDDEAAARGDRDSWPGGSVTIAADPAVRPGACVVQTSQGQIDVGVDAQVKELATALLGDAPPVAAAAPR